jgi:L,D-transpeptidase catalytic domain
MMLAVAVGPAAAAGPVRPAHARGPLGNERLSNERTVTRWAHPFQVAAIWRAPTRDGRRVGRLRLYTEDGYPEVYLALSSRRDGRDRVWIKVRIPGRPNGQKGWVRSTVLGPLQVARTALLIDTRHSRATLRRNGRRVWRAPIGHGAPGMQTPRGRFWIRERLANLGGSPIYGPWAFGTSAYSDTLTDWPGGGVVGIHGTNQPELIPGRPSHGCIRVPNPRIRKLARIMPLGTPVRIR